VTMSDDSPTADGGVIESNLFDPKPEFGALEPVVARTMRILVSGSSGLVGSALVPHLMTGGHTVVRLVRPRRAGPVSAAARESAVTWDPTAGTIDAAALQGIDAVVHLAGESVAAGRWNKARKARIHDSRIDGTRLLSAALARLDRPPQVLVSASAIGYYGSRGETILCEDSPAGTDFLSRVCREWEDATGPAAARGVRVVQTRFGFILSPAGGGLKKMLPPFKLGAGGRLGDGRQYLSWVSIDDVVGAVEHALRTGGLRGPVNVVAPNPVTNATFTRVLARVLSRPAFLPMPAFAARLVFGEVADALLLASQRVEPARLTQSAYRFLHPELEAALRQLLGRPAA